MATVNNPSIDRSLTQFSGTDVSSAGTGSARSLLGDVATGLTSVALRAGNQEKTILERFAERREQAGTSAEAERGLIEGRAAEDIEEEKASGERTLTSEREAQRGFASNPALLRAVTQDTEKRVRNLKRDRDDLLLQSKFREAERIDKLILDEETALTNARTESMNALTSAAGIVGKIADLENFDKNLELQRQTLQETMKNNAFSQALSVDQFEENKRQFGLNYALQQSKLAVEAAEKADKKTAEEQEKVGQAFVGLQAVNAVLADEDITSVTGLGRTLARGGENRLRRNRIEQVLNVITVGERAKLKGQGTITDFETTMLARAASSLGDNPFALGDDQFIQAMSEVQGAFKNAAGLAAPVLITDDDGNTSGAELTRDQINELLLRGFDVSYTPESTIQGSAPAGFQSTTGDTPQSPFGNSNRNLTGGSNFSFTAPSVNQNFSSSARSLLPSLPGG